MGIEILRALTMDGIPCGVVAPHGDPAPISRFAARTFDWDWTAPMELHDSALVARFVRYAAGCASAPVLLPCSDEPMLFISRFRRELGQAFRFLLPTEDLVEALVDKARFAELAARLDLPVPATRILDTGSPVPPDVVPGVGFPLMLKPRKLDRTWLAVDPLSAKALRIDSAAQLGALWPRLHAFGAPVIGQEHVDGPESRVESYHVYVDSAGEIVAEFTGRKIRTLPERYGYTSALRITDDATLRELGRGIVRRIELRGVAKLDFKRDVRGRLYLLEINPRLTLWNHPAAVAGVNVPALVYADLTGRARPPTAPRPRPVTWWHPKDLVAARRHGVPLRRWLPWAVRAEAKGLWSWRDPAPFLAVLGGRTRRRLPPPLRRRRRAAAGG